MDVASPTSKVELSDRIRAFLAKPNYATLATVGADGEPHQAVIWFRFDDDGSVLVNSRAGRRWPAELQGDRRCSLAVTDRNDPFRWVGLQAVVESVVDDVEVAREDIVALSVQYGEFSADSADRFRSQPRISFRLRIVGAHDHLDD
jgi:PPOX class probable F420-dependent enzyme